MWNITNRRGFLITAMSRGQEDHVKAPKLGLRQGFRVLAGDAGGGGGVSALGLGRYVQEGMGRGDFFHPGQLSPVVFAGNSEQLIVWLDLESWNPSLQKFAYA